MQTKDFTESYQLIDFLPEDDQQTRIELLNGLATGDELEVIEALTQVCTRYAWIVATRPTAEDRDHLEAISMALPDLVFILHAFCFSSDPHDGEEALALLDKLKYAKWHDLTAAFTRAVTLYASLVMEEGSTKHDPRFMEVLAEFLPKLYRVILYWKIQK